MPMLKEKFPTFEGFAQASLSEIYSDEKLDQAYHLMAKRFDHLYLSNESGEFVSKPLPRSCQFSPALALQTKDINKDGSEDLLLAGNVFETEVETPAYDAGRGTILLKQKGSFSSIFLQTQTGLSLHKSLKKLAWLSVDEDEYVLGANNNGQLDIYRYNKQIDSR